VELRSGRGRRLERLRWQLQYSSASAKRKQRGMQQGLRRHQRPAHGERESCFVTRGDKTEHPRGALFPQRQIKQQLQIQQLKQHLLILHPESSFPRHPRTRRRRQIHAHGPPPPLPPPRLPAPISKIPIGLLLHRQILVRLGVVHRRGRQRMRR